MPLNISRETMQDSALVRQLNKAVTGRVIRWLKDIGKKDPEKYKSFFDQFGNYIKEGVCVDHQNKTALLPLLRFSSSDSEEKLHSFDEYVSRMPEGQESIYYLSSPSYKQAMTSPYLEVFKEKGYEVLFLHEDIDEFMMSNLPEYEGKKLVNAEGANLDLVDAASDAKMTKEEQEQLCKWLKDVLGDRVSDVRPTSRLVDSPCVVVNHESATMRKLAKMHGMGGMSMGSRQELEVNTEHNMLGLLQQLRGREGDEKEMAEQVAHQLLDNSLLAAGVLEDSRTMVTRLNKLLEQCLESKR